MQQGDENSSFNKKKSNRMKKIAIISTLALSIAVMMISCGGKRDTGRTYMPDMAYSRAYESYAERDSSVFTTDVNDRGHKIFYNKMPESGKKKRGKYNGEKKDSVMKEGLFYFLCFQSCK